MKVKTLVLFSAAIFFISAGTLAKTKSDLIDGLSNCVNILNDDNRLLCFDKLARNNVLASTPLKTQNPTVSQIDAVKLKKAKQVDDFSKVHLAKTQQEKGLESINATISKVKRLIRGEWVIYFENGQKWQQKDSGKIKLKVGDKIRLQKGSLGAVYLFKEDSKRSIRVKRLK